MNNLVFGRYDYAACLTFGCYALCSMVIPMTLVPMAIALGFPLEDGGMGLGGALQLGRSIPMVLAMLLCGFVSGVWGKRRTLGMSILLMAFGIMASSLSPAYSILFAALAVSGLGEGVIEGLATPFVQDLHPDQPGRYLNITHAFWSVGVVALTLVAGALLYYGVLWRYIVFGVGAVSLLPSLLLLWPNPNEQGRDHADKMHWRHVCRNIRQLLRIKRFWLFFAAMFFAGGAEFCLTFWCASFIQIEYGGTAWAAGAGTAFFAAGMVAGRLGSGYYIHQHQLKKLLIAMSALGTGICLFFPWLHSLGALFLLLFLSGIAIGPFWPSIQSDGAQRIAGDNTMMMIMFSCAGVPGCGFFTTLMGIMGDWAGLRLSFLLVPACFFIVLMLMAWDWLAEMREKKSSAPTL